jgi:hypothetical protein
VREKRVRLNMMRCFWMSGLDAGDPQEGWRDSN